MDFVPELINGAVILNSVNVCTIGNDCRSCAELSVGIHNWLVNNRMTYLIVDFQDEKEVCSAILTELLQLRKRMRIPFVFCGMMEGPRKYLKSFAYNDHPCFAAPEEAVAYLKKTIPEVLQFDVKLIKVAEPIPCIRSRSYRAEEADGVEPDDVDGEPDT
ncbi:MAG: hypothetical protein NTX25_18155 [Proteobacteria bacterium]|nr:hypothetical protein [Pseudomonadota bacterium]